MNRRNETIPGLTSQPEAISPYELAMLAVGSYAAALGCKAVIAALDSGDGWEDRVPSLFAEMWNEEPDCPDADRIRQAFATLNKGGE